MNTRQHHRHTDVGPATPPPPWCEPGTEGQWDRLVEDCGGGITCRWARYFPPDETTADVWIECEDTIENGRTLRTPPRIGYTEPSRRGLTPKRRADWPPNCPTPQTSSTSTTTNTSWNLLAICQKAARHGSARHFGGGPILRGGGRKGPAL